MGGRVKTFPEIWVDNSYCFLQGWSFHHRLSSWTSMTSFLWIHVDYSWWFPCPSCAQKWFPGLILSPSWGFSEADWPVFPWILELLKYEFCSLYQKTVHQYQNHKNNNLTNFYKTKLTIRTFFCRAPSHFLSSWTMNYGHRLRAVSHPNYLISSWLLMTASVTELENTL